MGPEVPQTEQQRWQSRKSRSRERENKLSNRERTAHSLGEKEMGHHCSTYPFLTLQRVQKKSKHALAILTHKSWTKLSSKHLQGLTAKPTCMGQLTAGWVLQTQISGSVWDITTLVTCTPPRLCSCIALCFFSQTLVLLTWSSPQTHTFLLEKSAL